MSNLKQIFTNDYVYELDFDAAKESYTIYKYDNTRGEMIVLDAAMAYELAEAILKNKRFTMRYCPFCKSDEVRAEYDAGGAYHFVFCENCEARGPAADDEAEAILKWNNAQRRTE